MNVTGRTLVVVGSLLFPFVVAARRWLTKSRLVPPRFRNGPAVNSVLGSALWLSACLAAVETMGWDRG